MTPGQNAERLALIERCFDRDGPELTDAEADRLLFLQRLAEAGVDEVEALPVGWLERLASRVGRWVQ